MSDLAIIVAAGAATYGLRVSFIALLAGRRLPAGVERLVAQVKPAALAAVATTAVVSRDAVDPAHIAALAAAAIVARRRPDILLSLAAGMAVLVLLTAVT